MTLCRLSQGPVLTPLAIIFCRSRSLTPEITFPKSYLPIRGGRNVSNEYHCQDHMIAPTRVYYFFLPYEHFMTTSLCLQKRLNVINFNSIRLSVKLALNGRSCYETTS